MTQRPRSFWVIHLIVPALIGLALLYIYPATNLDRLLIAPYFDPVSRVFPLKRDPFLEHFMHQGLKNLITLFSLFILALAIRSSFYRPWRIYKRKLTWSFIGLLCSTAIISIMKHYSIHGCPWSLLEYGGDLPYLELFSALPEGVKAGHCFPGGHASAGFALMTFYFVFLDKSRFFAQLVLAGAFTLGMLMGWSQMARGAHFMSHNLWTAWIVWMVLLTLYVVWPPHAPQKKPGSND